MNSIGIKQMRQLVTIVTDWACMSDREKTLPASVVNELSTMVTRAMYDKDYERLCLLRDRIGPLTNRIRKKTNRLSEAERQALELLGWLNMTRGMLFIMEYDDPEKSVELIDKGAIVLKIIAQIKEATGGRPVLKNKEIQSRWPADQEKPSEATISRVLAALEKAGFLLRSGTTKNRAVHLTPKADNFLKPDGSVDDSTLRKDGSIQPRPVVKRRIPPAIPSTEFSEMVENVA